MLIIESGDNTESGLQPIILAEMEKIKCHTVSKRFFSGIFPFVYQKPSHEKLPVRGGNAGKREFLF